MIGWAKKAFREKEALWGQVCMGALITQSDQGQVGRKSCSRAYKEWARAAKRAGIGELDSSIAKDLIDSEDPKHTLFCRKIAFAAIYALFRDNITIF